MLYALSGRSMIKQRFTNNLYRAKTLDLDSPSATIAARLIFLQECLATVTVRLPRILSQLLLCPPEDFLG